MRRKPFAYGSFLSHEIAFGAKQLKVLQSRNVSISTLLAVP